MNKENDQQEKLEIVSPTALLLFARIDAEEIKPTPRMAFLLSEWGIWLLWLLTIIFGAWALAVSGYVTLSAQYALYEATHENFITFFVAVIPYIWVSLFVLMTYMAVFEIKKTKNGYRYNTVFIVSSNIAGTVFGALLLHYLGLGYALDNKLGEQVGMYMSIEKMEQKMWQRPENGRLIGELIRSNKTANNFHDITGFYWKLTFSELTLREIAIIEAGVPVRLLGTTTDQGIFHVCGVFPQQKGRARAWQEMGDERQEFFRVIHGRRDLELDDKLSLNQNISNNTEHLQLCSNLEIMKRIR